MTTTLLDKGYVYIVPAGASEESRPVKVGFEGGVQTFDDISIKGRKMAIPMYQKVGIGLASGRYGMAFYEDTSL